MVSLLQDSNIVQRRVRARLLSGGVLASFVAEIGGHLRSGRGKEGALGIRQLDTMAGNWLSPLYHRIESD